MLYALLCYNDEKTIEGWSKEHDDEIMSRLISVNERLQAEKKLGPVARLSFTKSAKTLRKTREPALLLDGPFAETKEQLLGFYVVDCETEEEALSIARELAVANPGGSYEIRPVRYFMPGSGVRD